MILFLLAALVLSPQARHQRPAQRPVQRQSADLLLFNGNFVTQNARQASAQAVAIRDGRIIWTGTTAEGHKKFDASEEQDLHGWTVLPGLIDAHTHLLSLGESYLKLNLKGVSTPEEAASRVRERIRNAKPGEWIVGWGWDEGAWAANYPSHTLLTEAAPANPVVLQGLHTFATWVNQAAMDAAGIKGSTGIVTGADQTEVMRAVPPLTLEQRKHAIELAARDCLRAGLTEVHEARVSADDILAFRALLSEGKLPLRISAWLDGADDNLIEQWMKKGPEIDPQHRFTVRTVKVFADGALGSRGAALLEPYSDAPERQGSITTPPDKLEELTRRCQESGFQVATHAIGDAANRMVLDVYERALKAVPRRDARLRIEHAQVLAPTDIPRFAKLGVIASMQPSHATSDMAWAEKRLGPERVRGAYAWQSVAKMGAHLPLSSDFPGETLNPFAGMYAAVTRQDPDGNPAGGWYPDQRLTIDQALAGYTTEAAYADFEENDKGRIDVGYLADFTVIDQDFRKLPPKEWLSISVKMTMVGGRFVR